MNIVCCLLYIADIIAISIGACPSSSVHAHSNVEALEYRTLRQLRVHIGLIEIDEII